VSDVPKYFTHYWKNQTWEREWELWETSPENYPLNHAADNKFAERGVALGDYVYPVTVMGGELYLLGRMRVDKVCGFEEAARELGTEDLWEADDHVVSAERPGGAAGASGTVASRRRRRYQRPGVRLRRPSGPTDATRGARA
jgi:hypothetical protein